MLSLLSYECYIANLSDAPETELKFDQKTNSGGRLNIGVEIVLVSRGANGVVTDVILRVGN